MADKKKAAKAYKANARYCPKCGPGVRLAEHANRWSCGKCKYAEMKPKQ
jgi:small subunit ribosomal protein S27Ae